VVMMTFVNRKNVLFTLAVIWSAAFFTTSCKELPTSSDGQTESLKATRYEPFKNAVNLYLYSFPTRIPANGRPAIDLCWYYKEVPQTGTPVPLEEALATAVRLNTNSINTDVLQKSFKISLGLQGANLAMSTSGLGNCGEAAIGAAVILTMPVLTGTVIAPTVIKSVQCAMSIYGVVSSTNAVQRNIGAQNSVGSGSLNDKMNGASANTIWRIKDAVEKNGLSANTSDDDLCPTSAQIIQFQKRHGATFPGKG